MMDYFVELVKIGEMKTGSLSALARQTGIDRSTLKRIKNGSTNAPHPDTIRKLKRAARQEQKEATRK